MDGLGPGGRGSTMGCGSKRVNGHHSRAILLLCNRCTSSRPASRDKLCRLALKTRYRDPWDCR